MKFKSQKDRKAEYEKVFLSKSGRMVLDDISIHANLLTPSYTKNDPYETAFNEGQRNVVLRILKLLKMDVSKFNEQILNGEQYG